MLKSILSFFRREKKTRIEKLKKHILLLGPNEIIVVNNSDGTRSYYSRSQVDPNVIKNAARGVYPDSIFFYFLEENEL